LTVAVLRRGGAILEEAAPDHHVRFDSMSLLGEALLGQHWSEEAEPLVVHGCEGLKARRRTITSPANSSLSDAAGRVLRLYEAWGKPAELTKWGSRVGLADLPADVWARARRR
jgi:hypothetical protein